jgi:purine-binding chemotaxis protein CheW
MSMSMSTAATAQSNNKGLAGRYLTFSLGRDSYGVPVLNVREIIRLCPITPVPRMPAYVKGVINLRGTVIAVLDLRAKFEMPTVPGGDRTCIIVVQIQTASGANTLMGAIVDAVEEVVNLAASDVEPTPNFGGSPDVQYMLGVATIRGGVKTLLNIEKIFQEDGSLTLPPLSKSASPTEA